MSDANHDTETWVIRLLFGAVVSLFLTWLMQRVRTLENSYNSDKNKVNELAGRLSVLDVKVERLSESDIRNSKAIVHIVESTTRIEGALLGFGGKGGLISTMEVLADKVQELTSKKTGGHGE